ncbi:hypothetical protein FBU59_006712 [Linderina macrospora]|uniref:Uncharacterized protein n=1 Tax=Linderina macrospora TaxID=4868 RepID=A0ACC1IZ12_9FUNG|nr:hypothetical protein FBU59_006712 [Linderina macrospora]
MFANRTVRRTLQRTEGTVSRHFSNTTKRIALQQQSQAKPQDAPAARSKVPAFTVPRSEFMVADLFAQSKQMLSTSGEVQAMSGPRASFRTLSELSLLEGQSAAEALVPRAPLKQIYAAPASVFMRVTPDAAIPEAMRLGPLAEPLLGMDPFRDGMSSLNLKGEEVNDFVEEFFDTIVAGGGIQEIAEPVAEEAAEGYQMTSVLRKRKSKMNKHKHRKLRKRTRALRKRLGK